MKRLKREGMKRVTRQEISKALRWMAKETEFLFGAETLRAAANEINHLIAETNGQAEMIKRLEAQLAEKTDLLEATIAGQETLQKALNRRAQPENEPIVRCGECERRVKSADLTDSVLCRYLGEHQMRKTDYCSYGERKPERSEE